MYLDYPDTVQVAHEITKQTNNKSLFKMDQRFQTNNRHTPFGTFPLRPNDLPNLLLIWTRIPIRTQWKVQTNLWFIYLNPRIFHQECLGLSKSVAVVIKIERLQPCGEKNANAKLQLIQNSYIIRNIINIFIIWFICVLTRHFGSFIWNT